MFLALLVSNALISFAYSKNEIVSVTGVFYAWVAALAMRALLDHPWPQSPRTPLLVVGMGLVCCGWAMRDVGLHARLLRSAFEARDEWGSILAPGNEGLSPVAVQLGADVLERRARPTSRLPTGWLRWWEPN